MSLRIAVAGNPNAGKSTLFNALSGARARVGNYPGVTVERREAKLTLGNGTCADLIDLPGCYSLVARSTEEDVAHRVLVGELGLGVPDRVLCVVDATQLARGLYLVLQLLELGLPCVVALNMMDVAQARGVRVDTRVLSQKLGVPVVPLAARSGVGISALTELLGQPASAPHPAFDLGLGLDASARAAIDEVAATWHQLRGPTDPPGHAEGHSLWLMTSCWGELAQPLPAKLQAVVERCVKHLDPLGTGHFNRQIITARYGRVDSILTECLDIAQAKADTRSQAIDRVVLHPVGGMLVFIAAMFVLFQAVFAWAAPFMGLVSQLTGVLADFAQTRLPEGYARSLIVNGIIAGMGSVLTFVPQIAFLFFGLALLEESGYLARAAFLLDRLMRRVGLHGKAFIPLMSSFACAIPGIMAARTLECRRDRLVTILVAPFMSCSARLPVYTLVVAAVFAAAPPVFGVLSLGGLVVLGMYLLGFFAAIGTAFVLKRSVLRSAPTALLLELPAYRMPDVRAVLRLVFERCVQFVRGTGRIIMALSIILWALLTFPETQMPAAQRQAQVAQAQALGAGPAQDAALTQLDRDARAWRLKHSIGGRMGRALEPAIAPLGFDWRIGIGLIASFAAREVLVSTLGQIYALDADVAADSPSLRDALRADVDPLTGRSTFTPLVGLSLMVFFVLALQCLSTLATVRRETASWPLALGQLVYMNSLAYMASLAVYQGGRALGYS